MIIKLNNKIILRKIFNKLNQKVNPVCFHALTVQ